MSATPPEPPADTPAAGAAKALVMQALVTPLAKREGERSRYSRMAMAPLERRVRIVDATPAKDARGALFFTFVIDARRGKDFEPTSMTGCVYQDGGAVYVKRGEEFRAAAESLGTKAKKPPPTVCRPVAAPST